MAKPLIHARSSARKWGGVAEDYLKIHDWMDHSKSAHAAVTHRAVLHSAFGIYLLEQVFGHTILNSEGKEVHVRDIGEQHVLEDLGWIPSLSHWLDEMSIQPWMAGRVPKELRPNAENRGNNGSRVVPEDRHSPSGSR